MRRWARIRIPYPRRPSHKHNNQNNSSSSQPNSGTYISILHNLSINSPIPLSIQQRHLLFAIFLGVYILGIAPPPAASETLHQHTTANRSTTLNINQTASPQSQNLIRNTFSPTLFFQYLLPAQLHIHHDFPYCEIRFQENPWRECEEQLWHRGKLYDTFIHGHSNFSNC